MSNSFPYLSLITPLSCYSISFCAYSYPVSSILIHIVGSHSSIRHRTQLLISIHSHINTPYSLPSCILFHFYSSIHTPLHPPSLLYSLLIHPLIILPIHSFPHPLSPILFSFHPSSYSISTPLSFPLLPLSSTSHYRIRFSPSILLFVSILLFIPILLLLLLTFLPLSSSTLIHATSILFLLFSLIPLLFFSTPIIFFFTIPIHSPIISLFQSLLLPYH